MYPVTAKGVITSNLVTHPCDDKYAGACYEIYSHKISDRTNLRRDALPPA
jgi:hypothetical protein